VSSLLALVQGEVIFATVQRVFHQADSVYPFVSGTNEIEDGLHLVMRMSGEANSQRKQYNMKYAITYHSIIIMYILLTYIEVMSTVDGGSTWCLNHSLQLGVWTGTL
jgi:hypothetical protein